MTARVTRTYADVAGSAGSPTTRVFRFGAQVLTLGATSKLVSQTVVLGQTLDYYTPKQNVTQTVVLSGTPDVIFFRLAAAHTLKMGQALANPPQSKDVAQTAVFSHLTSSSVTLLDISQTLRLKGSVSLTEWNQSVSQTAVFAGTASKVLVIAGAIPLSVTQTFKITQNVARIEKFRTVYHNLKFSHSRILEHIRLVGQEFVIGDENVLNLFLPLSGSSTIVFKHGFLVERPASTCKYDPIFGGGDGITTMPGTIPSAMVHGSSIKFVYPAVANPSSWTKTVTLRNPEIGDRFRNQMDRIYRENRMGTLQVYRDEEWPEHETISASIRVCTETNAQDFLDFVDQTLGEDIGFLDWENNSWKGIMLSTAEPIVRTRDDIIDINFEFVILGALT